MKNTPGPLALPVNILPSLNTTARSYSWEWFKCFWTGKTGYTDLNNLDDAEEGEWEGDADEEDGDDRQYVRHNVSALLTGYNYEINMKTKDPKNIQRFV